MTGAHVADPVSLQMVKGEGGYVEVQVLVSCGRGAGLALASVGGSNRAIFNGKASRRIGIQS